MTDQVECADRRTDLPIFIHSALDDYGLTSSEFRVYARIARRAGSGKAFESVVNMAKEFKLSVRTVQRCLKLLCLCNLLAETTRPGKSSLYSLLPQSVWFPSRDLKGTRTAVFCKPEQPSGGDTRDWGSGDTSVTPDTRDWGGVTPETGVVVTPETDEGTPSEVTPPKVIQKKKQNSAREASRATKAPEDFKHPQAPEDIAREFSPKEIEMETAQFLDHARANGKSFIDWDAAWRTWMRNAAKWKSERSQRKPQAARGHPGKITNIMHPDYQPEEKPFTAEDYMILHDLTREWADKRVKLEEIRAERKITVEDLLTYTQASREQAEEIVKRDAEFRTTKVA